MSLSLLGSVVRRFQSTTYSYKHLVNKQISQLSRILKIKVFDCQKIKVIKRNKT